ncbi:endonuclease V [Undibacterium luofuense]|uniref:Endonuclease V n=1 Tax=Undibacterium luofuense TaxID=2828733 RepID=A0A941DK17_9BURK|nr:endonuclease V [Undibacterium luofuense]MBR7781265.1 endonuclease V [Undibacterium luofuense]
MILAVDVGYSENGAKAVGAIFHDWESETIHKKFVVDIPEVEEYVPGQFFRRELPCIEKVLESVDEPIDCIVIDGHVSLGESQAPGLGAKLWEKLNGAIPVIGVAKSAYLGNPEEAKLFRGQSTRPLFISAKGMTLEEAKQRIQQMRGKYRLPDILKLVDQISHGY